MEAATQSLTATTTAFALPFRAPAPAGDPRAIARCAWRVLEEIDYGLILLGANGELQHANQLGWNELARARFLRLEDGLVTGESVAVTQELRRGLQAAALGRRHMLMLREAGDVLPVTCVPLMPSEGSASPVLLMLARQTATRNLNVGFFSRTHGLTAAEESVLRHLCEGLQVKEIARVKGITPSTVRTHLRSLREKTGLRHIRLLAQRVAMLPPMLPTNPTLPGTPGRVVHQ
jgi:DNA-binding CsgD family transcriptional regulator